MAALQGPRGPMLPCAITMTTLILQSITDFMIFPKTSKYQHN